MKIELHPQMGKQAVHGHGCVLGHVDVDTGMLGIYLMLDDRGPDLWPGVQVGLVHKNDFVSFTIPNPPEAMKEAVAAELEKLGRGVLRMASPPPIEADDE